MSIPVEVLRAALPAQYSVERFLASGGQGSVYLGTVNGAPAAIKLFNSSADPRRIQRELEALTGITCSNLVRLLDYCTVNVAHAPAGLLAYDYHSGGDLQSVVATRHLSPVEILKIGHEVSSAIDALWQHRIVHRDIKPANIVKAADGRCVLVDVGFARHIARSAISGVGQWAGTQGYMSPEQAMGRHNLTFRSDVFSLGVTLYLLAARRHPFQNIQPSIGSPSPRPLNDLRRDLTAEFCALVHRMMFYSPVSRPADVTERISRILGS